MNPQPAALWQTNWQGLEIAVFDLSAPDALTPEQAGALLSPGEQSRAARFHFQVDRDHWTQCRAIARLVLADALRCSPRELDFAESPYGKPFLPAFPAFQCNWSHSGSHFAIVRGRMPCGIDIEQRKPGLPFAELSAHAFQTEEASMLEQSADPAQVFYALWTAKEAVMKCDGRGMSLTPAAIRIELKDGLPAAGLAQDDSGSIRYDLHAAIIGEYSLCAATPAA